MNKLSGELFDLTITSINNDFGYEKIKYSIKYGISTPISKYIDEFKMILSKTDDIKNEKRQIRMLFLNEFKGDRFFELYFRNIMCYLNGGYNFHTMKKHHEENKIIITVAGGNVLTIFANLVKDLLTFAISNYTSEISKFNYMYCEGQIDYVIKGLNDFGGKQKWNYILGILDDPKYKHYLLDSYSDFDYNLLPNKEKNNSDFKSQLQILNTYYDKEKSSQGFVLLRVKTLLDNPNGYVKSFTNVKGIKSCKYFKNFMAKYEGMETPEIHYIAQLINENNVNIFKRNMDILDKNKAYLKPKINNKKFTNSHKICSEFLDFLLSKKKSIADETKFNVKTTIYTFKKGYTKNVKVNDIKNASVVQVLKPVVGANKYKDLNSIIEYLHLVTETLNTYIYYWENGLLGVSKGRHSNSNSLLNFKSQKSICGVGSNGDNSKLLYLASYLVQVFLNGPELHTEQILDTILEKKQKVDKDIYMSPSVLTLVPPMKTKSNNTANIWKNLRKINEYLSHEMYEGIGYPDGINITINSIFTNNNNSSEKDIIEDITNNFTNLIIKDDIPLVNRNGDQNIMDSDNEEYDLFSEIRDGESFNDWWERMEDEVSKKAEDDDIINYQWQYQSDSGKWYNYHSNNNLLISKAWHNEIPYITIQNSNGTFNIDLQSQTQINTNSGAINNIRRQHGVLASGVNKPHKKTKKRKPHKKTKKRKPHKKTRKRK